MKFLDKLQQDEKISGLLPSHQQYRLLAHHLNLKKGVRVFGVNSLSKLSEQVYKEPIRKIAQEIYAFNDFKVRIR